MTQERLGVRKNGRWEKRQGARRELAVRRLRYERLAGRCLMAADLMASEFQHKYDVNGDGEVSLLDPLGIINYLNRGTAADGRLPEVLLHMDVNQDSIVNVEDSQRVVAVMDEISRSLRGTVHQLSSVVGVLSSESAWADVALGSVAGTGSAQRLNSLPTSGGMGSSLAYAPCDRESIVGWLSYDEHWGSGREVKDPNDPEDGVAIYETGIPFTIEVSVSGCTAHAMYEVEVYSVTSEGRRFLETSGMALGPGGSEFLTRSYVVPSGNSSEVKLEVSLYYVLPPDAGTQVERGFGRLQDPLNPQQPGGGKDRRILRDFESVLESIDETRIDIMEVVPDKVREQGVLFAEQKLPELAVDRIFGSLLSQDARNSIIRDLEVQNNLTTEQASDLLNARLDYAAGILEDPLRPVMRGYADRLFSTERPDAQPLFGSGDLALPKSRWMEVRETIKFKLDQYLDNIPDFPLLPGLKQLDYNFEFNSFDDILKSDAGPSLIDYLRTGQIGDLATDFYDTDWDNVPIIRELGVTYNVPDVGASLTLGLEDLTLDGPQAFSLSGDLGVTYVGRQFTFMGRLAPSVRYAPNSSNDLEYGIGFQFEIIGNGRR